MRERLYLPGQRYELHHRICHLRYGTHGYGRSAYRIKTQSALIGICGTPLFIFVGDMTIYYI